jgi:hypothetical protein
VAGIKNFGLSDAFPLGSQRFTHACENCHGRYGQRVLSPFVVAPAPVKGYELHLWYLWSVLEQLLLRTSDVILIGIAVRDDDLMMQHALALLGQRNTRLKQITVVNPDSTVYEKVQNLTGLSVVERHDLRSYLDEG